MVTGLHLLTGGCEMMLGSYFPLNKQHTHCHVWIPDCSKAVNGASQQRDTAWLAPGAQKVVGKQSKSSYSSIWRKQVKVNPKVKLQGVQKVFGYGNIMCIKTTGKDC